MPRHKQPQPPISSPLRPLRLVGKYFPEDRTPPPSQPSFRPQRDLTAPTLSSRAHDIRSPSKGPPRSPSVQGLRHKHSSTNLRADQHMLRPSGSPSPCRPSLSKRSSMISLRQSMSPSPTPPPRRTFQHSNASQPLLSVFPTTQTWARTQSRPTTASDAGRGPLVPARTPRTSLHLASTAASRSHQVNISATPVRASTGLLVVTRQSSIC